MCRIPLLSRALTSLTKQVLNTHSAIATRRFETSLCIQRYRSMHNDVTNRGSAMAECVLRTCFIKDVDTLSRRGGRDIKKIAPKAPLKERPGWSVVTLRASDHPVCARRTRVDTPPRRGRTVQIVLRRNAWNTDGVRHGHLSCAVNKSLSPIPTRADAVRAGIWHHRMAFDPSSI
jgi:hypothetical protein